jgi:hypothetical protein
MCSPSNRTARAACPICWRATENAQGQIDGLVSANSYVSTDGAWVVNYAQWRSAEAFLAMVASAGRASARRRMRLGPHPYSVESVHTSNHFSGSEP